MVPPERNIPEMLAVAPELMVNVLDPVTNVAPAETTKALAMVHAAPIPTVDEELLIVRLWNVVAIGEILWPVVPLNTTVLPVDTIDRTGVKFPHMRMVPTEERVRAPPVNTKLP